MKDFLFAMVAVIFAATPKSASKEKNWIKILVLSIKLSTFLNFTLRHGIIKNSDSNAKEMYIKWIPKYFLA